VFKGFVIVRKDFMDLIAHFQPKIGNYLAKIIAMEEVIVSVESVIVILDILDKHANIKPILCVQEMDFVVGMASVIMADVFVIWNLLEINVNKDTVILQKMINLNVQEKDFVKMTIVFATLDFRALFVRK